MKASHFFVSVFFILLLHISSLARAEEVILSYHTSLALEENGELQVTERIQLSTDGSTIKHGIYRDIPLTFAEPRGQKRWMQFSLIDVWRDGVKEQYRLEPVENGVRIWVGAKDVNIATGEHTYELSYVMKRVIRSSDGQDMLNFNLVEDGWAFPVLHASADIILPSGQQPQTALLYKKVRNSFKELPNEEKQARQFSTSERFEPGEGLLLSVKLPQGLIKPASAADRTLWLLMDTEQKYMPVTH